MQQKLISKTRPGRKAPSASRPVVDRDAGALQPGNSTMGLVENAAAPGRAPHGMNDAGGSMQSAPPRTVAPIHTAAAQAYMSNIRPVGGPVNTSMTTHCPYCQQPYPAAASSHLRPMPAIYG